jgi:S1-C subfamily serine protease
MRPTSGRAIVIGLVLLSAAVGAGGAVLLRAEQRARAQALAELAGRLDEERLQRQMLERQVAETLERLAAYRADVRAVLEARGDELATIERSVRRLDDERRAAERIIQAYGRGVALIQGMLVYEDAEGRPLRYGGTDNGPLHPPAPSTDGDGAVVRTTFLGTGFLVSRDGTILTSRHVAQPTDEELAELLEPEGLKARVVQLRAFFPGIAEPVALTPVRASATEDVMVLRARVPRSVPVVPLDRVGEGARPGRPVIVLGYPGGLRLLLARVEPTLLARLVEGDIAEISDETVDIPALLERLSRLDQIRPYVTQGHLADARPHQLAHDAEMSVGGSGGPIFAASGRVIGLTMAVVRDLDGAALGVPIRSALTLLDRGEAGRRAPK